MAEASTGMEIFALAISLLLGALTTVLAPFGVFVMALVAFQVTDPEV